MLPGGQKTNQERGLAAETTCCISVHWEQPGSVHWEQPGWASSFSRSWRPEALPPCPGGQRLGLKTQGLAAQGLVEGLNMWAWHGTSTIRSTVTKVPSGQYSFVDIRAQLWKSRSRWSPPPLHQPREYERAQAMVFQTPSTGRREGGI